jgi:hypothetical protein
MPSIFDWSSTAASNTSIDSINSNTGMTPANVDNLFRSMAAIIRATFASALQSFFAGTAALPIANGGTAATSASAARTSLGALSETYRDLPVTSKSGSFTVANSERGGIYLLSGSTGTITLDPAATTAINDGAVYRITNIASGSYTISAGGSVVINRNGANAVTSVVIAAGGSCTLIHVSSDFWTCDGSSIS